MNYAIILAGGKGSRMKRAVPSQFMELNGKPMVCHSIDTFEHNSNIDGIVLVTSSDYREYMEKLIQDYSYRKIIGIAEGGAERYDSVYSGLNCIRNSSRDVNNANNAVSGVQNNIFIHDGARPCVTDNIINACMRDVMQYKACVAAVPVKDTIKVVDTDGIAVNTPDRSTLWQIQTPQVFEYGLIMEAYDRLYADNDKSGITDDAMVSERYMHTKVKMTLSEYTNIKATTPEDILVTQIFLSQNTKVSM